MNYKHDIQILEDIIKELSLRQSALINEYQQVCKHPNVIHSKKYYSGGFDYQASTHHSYTCQDCGKFEFEIEQHNTGFE